MQKEDEKELEYKNLSVEIQRMWNVKCFLGRFHPFLYATKALRVSRGIALLFLGPRH